MIGEVVGSFRITGQIAVGGMGVVYRAEHNLIGKKAAVKVLRREFSANRDVVDRFFNEARATTVIRHPGIIDIYDFGYHHDDRAYIVMEYLEGETLKDRLQARSTLPLETAVRIIRSVAGAVGAAHAQGIIHRDLKPDNVFLVPDAEMPGGERIKVLDFGLAKLTEDQGASLDTQAGIVLGTPTYMAPEQCDGVGQIDHRADQYALGCILYQLLCGQPPFTSNRPLELFQAHRFQAPPPPRSIVPSIPAEVEKVILKLLSKSPADRFPDMDRVRIALDNMLSSNGDVDTLTEEPASGYLPPPPAALPPAYGPVSSMSGSSGQMMSMTPPPSMMSNPYGRQPSGPMMARPVRLPSIPGAMRRVSPIYWALGAMASILIGFGIVYMVLSMDEEEAILLPTESKASADPSSVQPMAPAADPQAAPGAPGQVAASDAGSDAEPAAAPGAAPAQPEDEALIEIEPEGAAGPGAAPAQLAGTPAASAGPASPALVDIALELVPAGAEVTVDGELRTERPVRLAPRPTPYRFVVTAPGFQRKVLSVRADRAKSVRVELEHAQEGIDL
jgi:serine/threonine protein kinase